MTQKEQRNFAILEKPAVWRQAEGIMGTGDLPTDEINVRVYAGGTRYQKGNTFIHASDEEKVYAYVKNYRKYKLNFSIFMYSEEPDIKKIEKFFDKLAKDELKKADVAQAIATATMSNFIYLDKNYK